jgi:hypothetical protein
LHGLTDGDEAVATAGKVDAVLEGEIGTEEVVGSAVLLNNDNDVAELSGLVACGDGKRCGERSQQQNPGGEFHGQALLVNVKLIFETVSPG